jgi:hypothetical protein
VNSEESYPTVGDTLAKVALQLVPYVGPPLETIYDDVRARLAAKARRTVSEIEELCGTERLLRRLTENPEIEAMFVAAVDSALRTGLERKRRYLARVVANAVLDDAKVDESELIVQALRDLDGPHLRALERLRHAEDSAHTDDAGKSAAVQEAAKQEPAPIRAVLSGTGAVIPAPFGGIFRVSPFGRTLLTDLANRGLDVGQ